MSTDMVKITQQSSIAVEVIAPESIRMYQVSEHQLETIGAAGSNESIYSALGCLAGGVFASTIVTLATVTPSPVVCACLVAMLVTCGFFSLLFGIFWFRAYRTRRATLNAVTRIQRA